MIKRVPILRNARGTGAYFIRLVVGGEDILQRGGGKGDVVIHGAIRADEEAVSIESNGVGGQRRDDAIDEAQVLPQLHGDGLRMQVIAGGDDSPVKG